MKTIHFLHTQYALQYGEYILSHKTRFFVGMMINLVGAWVFLAGISTGIPV